MDWLLILEMNIEWKRHCLCSVISWNIANILSQPLSRTEALIFPAVTLSDLLVSERDSNAQGSTCIPWLWHLSMCAQFRQHSRAILTQRSLGSWLMIFIVIISDFIFSENPASVTSSQVLIILWAPWMNYLHANLSISFPGLTSLKYSHLKKYLKLT